MYATLMEHLKINILLVDEQLGFRKNLATGDIISKLTYALLRD
jgi:hypothetical protein